jgi:hypothetical protein
MKIEIKEILFWISLIIAITLLLWNLLGNSPTETFTIIGIIFMLTLKIWFVSDNQIKSTINNKHNFNKINHNMDYLKSDINHIKSDLNLIKNKLGVKQ